MSVRTLFATGSSFRPNCSGRTATVDEFGSIYGILQATHGPGSSAGYNTIGGIKWELSSQDREHVQATAHADEDCHSRSIKI